jgi:predicted RNase H-like nuclease (RuvC/YqgF family)
MTSEEIQAALAAQIEFNRQIQQQTAENTQSTRAISRDIAQLVEFNRQIQQQTAENTQSIQAISRDVAQLVATQQEAAVERQELRRDLDRLTNITERYVNASTTVIQRLEEGIAELRAGQEQQARVLDYLLQKEQNGGNGG